jgi:hypothetical protein
MQSTNLQTLKYNSINDGAKRESGLLMMDIVDNAIQVGGAGRGREGQSFVLKI